MKNVFEAFASRLKSKQNYGSLLKMRVRYLRKPLESLETLWIHTENANLLSSQTALNPKTVWIGAENVNSLFSQTASKLKTLDPR